MTSVVKTVVINNLLSISINFYGITCKNLLKDEVYSITYLQIYSLSSKSFLKTTDLTRIEVNKEVKIETAEDFVTKMSTIRKAKIVSIDQMSLATFYKYTE